MSTTDKRDRTLTREVTVTQIPSGDKQTLFAGDTVFIHQVLGGSYTIQTSTGLYRLDGKDADAIGETIAVQTVTAATLADGAPDPEAIWDQLRKVYDPEIPVNIVDLGLVYSMDVGKQDDGYKVDVAMTLTAPGCGMGPRRAAAWARPSPRTPRARSSSFRASPTPTSASPGNHPGTSP